MPQPMEPHTTIKITTSDKPQLPESVPLNLEEIISLLKIPESDEKTPFKNLSISHDVFKKIKIGLIAAVANMEKKPSFISRAADFWGKLALWQKILGGLLIVLPTLVVGIVASINLLIVISCITAFLYIGIGIVLEDHYKNKTSVMDSLIKAISGLSDFLELTITALDSIRQKSEVQLNSFSAENEKLKAHLKLLSEEIAAAKELNDSLKKTKEDLERATEQLGTKITEQTDLLHLNQKELLRITEDYSASQALLVQKVAELEVIKTELGLQLDQAKKVGLIVQESALRLSRSVLNEEDAEVYQQKLEQFLRDKDKSFSEFAERICDTQKKLSLTEEKLSFTEEQLRQIREQYEKQLQELKRQIDRLIQQNERASVPQQEPSHFGFFVGKTSLPEDPLPLRSPSQALQMGI